MNIEKLHLIYFSATGTTERIINTMQDALKDIPLHSKCNLLLKKPHQQIFSSSELVVLAMPVYSGRIPQNIKDEIKTLKGDNTPTILICTYGNRAFEDALVELQDDIENNGFIAISAAAFIAQHSIFPKVATNRPDEKDLEMVKRFAVESMQCYPSNHQRLTIQGNRPYRTIKSVPLIPRTSSSCNNCEICVKQCPANAIQKGNPKHTDQSKCIACAHCISVCPQKAKHFGGLLYWLASKKFSKSFHVPQQPYMVYLK